MTDSLRRAAAALFPTCGRPRTTRVGVEQELLSFDTRTGDAVDIERVRRAVEGTPLARAIAFEPGGQVELNLPVRAGPALSSTTAWAPRCRSCGSAVPTQTCGSTPRRSTRGRSTGSPSSCGRRATSPCRSTSTGSARPAAG